MTFTYRDRNDGNRRKHAVLPADQFIGRFLRHVLPGRFVRMRHDGFLANGHRNKKLSAIRRLLGARPVEPFVALSAEQWVEAVLGVDPMQCPCCGDTLFDTSVPMSTNIDSRFLSLGGMGKYTHIRPKQPNVTTLRHMVCTTRPAQFCHQANRDLSHFLGGFNVLTSMLRNVHSCSARVVTC